MSMMQNGGSREESLMVSRALKYASTADERQTPMFLPFTDEHTMSVLEDALKREHMNNYFIYGGWEEAERCVLGFFPYSMLESDDEDHTVIKSCFPITWLAVNTGGYGEIGHRDCLGSFLASGIKREVLGDILTSSGVSFECSEGGKRNEKISAYVAVFDMNSMASYISESITSVGRTHVTLSPLSPEDIPSFVRQYDRILVPVSSLRLDCVVAELTGLSRSDSKELILRGLVSVDHAPLTRPDRQLSENSVISVRGYGKFRFSSVVGSTKRDRLRTEFLKYK